MKKLFDILESENCFHEIYNSNRSEKEIESIEQMLFICNEISRRIEKETEVTDLFEVLSIKDRYTVMKVDPEQIGQ